MKFGGVLSKHGILATLLHHPAKSVLLKNLLRWRADNIRPYSGVCILAGGCHGMTDANISVQLHRPFYYNKSPYNIKSYNPPTSRRIFPLGECW